MSIERLEQTPKPEGVQAFELAARENIGNEYSIAFVNFDQFSANDSRFLFGFTEGPEGAGFIKMCAKEELQQQLQREANGMQLARDLGARTVEVIHPYHESSDKIGSIHLKALDSKQGTTLHSPELIAGADAQLGAQAAEAILHITAKEIPTDKDTSFLKRNDSRNSSLESFWHTWEEAKETVLSSLSEEEKTEIQTLIESAEQALRPTINVENVPGKEYLIHNDAAPSNAFFDHTTNQTTLLDFEHVGATANPYLAMITDIGNFYGRCWPNPEMQRVFGKAILEKIRPARAEEGEKVLRGAMVFGAIYLAQFGVKKDHKEHPMTVSLLQNLKQNLDTVFASKI